MKITKADYGVMLRAMRALASEIKPRRVWLIANATYKNLEARLRWEIWYAAGLTRFACDTLYKYANDDHIDTALRRIIAEIEPN